MTKRYYYIRGSGGQSGMVSHLGPYTKSGAQMRAKDMRKRSPKRTYIVYQDRRGRK